MDYAFLHIKYILYTMKYFFTNFAGGLPIGAILGIVAAIVVVLILIFLAVYFLCKTQGKRSTVS